MSSLTFATPARTQLIEVTDSLSSVHEAQRTGVVLPPSEPERQQIPLRGSIITPESDLFPGGDGYYVLLGDEEEAEQPLQIDFHAPFQAPIVVGELITITQNITINNTLNETWNESVNLWDYAGQIEERLLTEFLTFSVQYGADILSEQAYFPLTLEVGELKTLALTYTYPAIQQTVECSENHLFDLVPQDAQIKYTDLPVDTLLSKTCTVQLNYARSDILFQPITVTLEDYPQLEGLSGYSSTTGKEIEVTDLQFEVQP